MPRLPLRLLLLTLLTWSLHGVALTPAATAQQADDAPAVAERGARGTLDIAVLNLGKASPTPASESEERESEDGVTTVVVRDPEGRTLSYEVSDPPPTGFDIVAFTALDARRSSVDRSGFRSVDVGGGPEARVYEPVLVSATEPSVPESSPDDARRRVSEGSQVVQTIFFGCETRGVTNERGVARTTCNHLRAEFPSNPGPEVSIPSTDDDAREDDGVADLGRVFTLTVAHVTTLAHLVPSGFPVARDAIVVPPAPSSDDETGVLDAAGAIAKTVALNTTKGSLLPIGFRNEQDAPVTPSEHPDRIEIEIDRSLDLMRELLPERTDRAPRHLPWIAKLELPPVPPVSPSGPNARGPGAMVTPGPDDPPTLVVRDPEGKILAYRFDNPPRLPDVLLFDPVVAEGGKVEDRDLPDGARLPILLFGADSPSRPGEGATPRLGEAIAVTLSVSTTLSAVPFACGALEPDENASTMSGECHRLSRRSTLDDSAHCGAATALAVNVAVVSLASLLDPDGPKLGGVSTHCVDARTFQRRSDEPVEDVRTVELEIDVPFDRMTEKQGPGKVSPPGQDPQVAVVEPGPPGEELPVVVTPGPDDPPTLVVRDPDGKILAYRFDGHAKVPDIFMFGPNTVAQEPTPGPPSFVKTPSVTSNECTDPECASALAEIPPSTVWTSPEPGSFAFECGSYHYGPTVSGHCEAIEGEPVRPDRAVGAGDRSEDAFFCHPVAEGQPETWVRCYSIDRPLAGNRPPGPTEDLRTVEIEIDMRLDRILEMVSEPPPPSVSIAMLNLGKVPQTPAIPEDERPDPPAVVTPGPDDPPTLVVRGPEGKILAYRFDEGATPPDILVFSSGDSPSDDADEAPTFHTFHIPLHGPGSYAYGGPEPDGPTDEEGIDRQLRDVPVWQRASFIESLGPAPIPPRVFTCGAFGRSERESALSGRCREVEFDPEDGGEGDAVPIEYVVCPPTGDRPSGGTCFPVIPPVQPSIEWDDAEWLRTIEVEIDVPIEDLMRESRAGPVQRVVVENEPAPMERDRAEGDPLPLRWKVGSEPPAETDRADGAGTPNPFELNPASLRNSSASVPSGVQSMTLDGSFTAPASGATGGPTAPGGGWIRERRDVQPRVYVTSLGVSTGEAFRVHVASDEPVSFTATGLVLEPVELSEEERERLLAEIEESAGTSAPVDGYCLNFELAVPEEGTIYRIADAEAQREAAPMRRILVASRKLHDAGRLHVQGDPEAYHHAIRQWAIWTREQGFDREEFENAFVEHTRENVEAAGRAWSREFEDVVLQAAPGRWRDIQAILEEAGP